MMVLSNQINIDSEDICFLFLGKNAAIAICYHFTLNNLRYLLNEVIQNI